MYRDWQNLLMQWISVNVMIDLRTTSNPQRCYSASSSYLQPPCNTCEFLFLNSLNPSRFHSSHAHISHVCTLQSVQIIRNGFSLSRDHLPADAGRMSFWALYTDPEYWYASWNCRTLIECLIVQARWQWSKLQAPTISSLKSAFETRESFWSSFVLCLHFSCKSWPGNLCHSIYMCSIST